MLEYTKANMMLHTINYTSGALWHTHTERLLLAPTECMRIMPPSMKVTWFLGVNISAVWQTEEDVEANAALIAETHVSLLIFASRKGLETTGNDAVGVGSLMYWTQLPSAGGEETPPAASFAPLIRSAGSAALKFMKLTKYDALKNAKVHLVLTFIKKKNFMLLFLLLYGCCATKIVKSVFLNLQILWTKTTTNDSNF